MLLHNKTQNFVTSASPFLNKFLSDVLCAPSQGLGPA